MGFVLYKRTGASGGVAYTRLKPLKLGGCDGLIARHVKTLRDAETRSWKLDVADLLRHAGHEAVDTAVLFDGSGRDVTNVCLYELTRIHGSCRDTSTQLALDMAVLIDREAGTEAAQVAQEFQVSSDAKPKPLSEMLALSGGPGGGDWKWGAMPLQLGATVVSPHPSKTDRQPV